MSLLGATYSFRKTLIASVFPGFDFIALYLTLSAGGRDEITPLYRNQLQATKPACLHFAAHHPDALSGGTGENTYAAKRQAHHVSPGAPCPGCSVPGSGTLCWAAGQ